MTSIAHDYGLVGEHNSFPDSFSKFMIFVQHTFNMHCLFLQRNGDDIFRSNISENATEIA